MKLTGWVLGTFIALPISARADISDSGALMIGGQAVIQGSATIAGNAFSIGASSLAVTGGRVGIGTAAPSSSLHVVNGDIRITTTTGSRGIIFQDGTTQTTASSSSGLYNVACTSSTTNQTTGASSFVGITGSTVTLAIGSSKRVRLQFSGGAMSSSAAGFPIRVTAMNGGVNLGDATNGLVRNDNPSGTYVQPMHFVFVSSAMASGTYNFSLMYNCTGASCDTVSSSSGVPWTFCAEELK